MNRQHAAPPTSRHRTLLPALAVAVVVGVAVVRRRALDRNAREFYRRYGRI